MFARHGAGPYRVIRVRSQQLVPGHPVQLGLRGRQPDGTAPHPLGTKRQGRSHLPPAADAAGAQHRNRRNRIHNFRDQHHAANLSGMSSGFVGLSDNHVHAGGFVTLGVLFLAGQGTDVETARMGRLSDPIRRRAECADQKPGLVFKSNIHDTLGLFLGIA